LKAGNSPINNKSITMKFITAIILTALLAFAGGLWFSWWIIAITAFIIAILVHQAAGKAFLSGFIGTFILWALLALLRDIPNESLLSKKIADVLPLGGSSFLLILVTAFIGALVAGLVASEWQLS
jgi:hypothetical protein